MADLNSRLFQVFERLRRQGSPLGISDYMEAIAAIQAGVGLEDATRFKELCRLLWAKSQQDQEIFDLAFAELVEPQLKITYRPRSTTPANTATDSPETQFQSEPSEPAEPTTPASTAPHSQDPEPTTDSPETQSQSEPGGSWPPQQEKARLASGSSGQLLGLQSELTEEPKRYQLTPRLPLSRRYMAGAWRQLRRPQREGPPEELDLEKTIKNICSSGFLLRPALQPRRRNQARLVVLVDRQGSMAPLAPFVEAAIESILKGGLLGKTSCYYFHDCPEQYLYQRPNLTRALPLEELLDREAKGNSVLIVGDAGAARGFYDKIKVADTKSFLQTLSTYTHLYAWLNPMPQNRWGATTAEDIADMVPMFPLDEEGLNDAVSVLRGHPYPSRSGNDSDFRRYP